jgi:DNA-binding transcriptional MerR regulator
VSVPESEQLGIAELAKWAGVTPRTVRYYVTEGLLPPPSGAGPHRFYSDEHLLRLQAILRLKEIYLPLSEIRRQLEGLSGSELEKLASGPVSQAMPVTPDYPPTIPPLPRSPLLPPQPPRSIPNFLASHAPPARRFAEPRLGAAYVLGEEMPAKPSLPKEVQQAADATGASLWHRVTLVPGVELSYQLTGDRLRDEAILRLAQIGRQILERTK